MQRVTTNEKVVFHSSVRMQETTRHIFLLSNLLLSAFRRCDRSLLCNVSWPIEQLILYLNLNLESRDTNLSNCDVLGVYRGGYGFLVCMKHSGVSKQEKYIYSVVVSFDKQCTLIN